MELFIFVLQKTLDNNEKISYNIYVKEKEGEL